MKRRDFCLGTLGAVGLVAFGGAVRTASAATPLLRPPGGFDENELIGACVRCDRCRSVCPHGCIALGALEDGWLNTETPVMDFTRGFCDFCADDPDGPRCIRVCPTGALDGASPEAEVIGCAVLDAELCVNCYKCVPACEYEALAWDETNLVPVVNEQKCNGCGACEYVCPSASFGYYDGSTRRAIAVERGGVQ